MLGVNDAKEIVENKIEWSVDKKTGERKKPKVTTAQLRKFLSAVNSVYNKVQNPESKFEDLKNEIQYLRVKLAYQAGRFKEVKDLAKQANLDAEINKINSKEDFIKFARFIEAIIAYHKFNKGE